MAEKILDPMRGYTDFIKEVDIAFGKIAESLTHDCGKSIIIIAGENVDDGKNTATLFRNAGDPATGLTTLSSCMVRDPKMFEIAAEHAKQIQSRTQSFDMPTLKKKMAN